MRVLAICKNTNGYTIGAKISTSNTRSVMCSTEQLKQMFVAYGSGVFENAILTKDGFVRARSGNRLEVEIHDTDVQKRNSILVYHGSPNETFTPRFGYGEDKHDYGRGFYTTPYKHLAKEWAVCLGNDGFLHTYSLDLTGLSILNFDKFNSLCWLAELMKHRDADTSSRYKRLVPKFIEKFGIDTANYDVIAGWRADSSYFQVAKRFVRNEIDYELLTDLLKLGDLKQQICIKSEKAYSRLKECSKPEFVSCEEYLPLYSKRDEEARQQIQVLINSDKNTMTHGFDYVMQAGVKL